MQRKSKIKNERQNLSIKVGSSAEVASLPTPLHYGGVESLSRARQAPKNGALDSDSTPTQVCRLFCLDRAVVVIDGMTVFKVGW